LYAFDHVLVRRSQKVCRVIKLLNKEYMLQECVAQSPDRIRSEDRKIAAGAYQKETPMKRLIVSTVGLGLLLLVMGSSAFCAEVVGSVSDLQGHPVSGVRIVVHDPAGKVLGQAIADAKGHYAIGGLLSRTYYYTLDPLTTHFKGGSVVSFLDSNGLTIDWKVSDGNSALAMATQGSKTVLAGDPFGLSMEEFAATVMLGTLVVAAGVIGGYGAAGGFSGESTSSSPSSPPSAPPGSPPPGSPPPTSSSM
jgi:hypothetical protein